MGFFDRFTKSKTENKKVKPSIKKAAEAKESASKLKVEKVKEGTTLKLKTDIVNAQGNKNLTAKKAKKDDTKLAYKILIKPLITEKATNLVSLNKYAFKVADNANKVEIKKAIKALYGFEPVSINIINARGKRLTYGRTRGKKSNWKKAIITLKASDKLEIYEGV
jgi:large subunit ribosomal protein L23